MAFTKTGKYRWVVLGMVGLTTFMNSVAQFQPAFFAAEIMTDYSMSASAFTAVTSAPMFVGAFIALLLGAASDKFGIKRMIFVCLVLSTLGAIFRLFSTSFVMLLASSLLLGVCGVGGTVNMAKLVMAWFEPRQRGVAMGFGSMAGGVGAGIAQACTGLIFATYLDAFMWSAIIFVVICVLWVLFGADYPDDMPAEERAAATKREKGAFKSVIKSRNLWLAAFAGFLFMGASIIPSSFNIVMFSTTKGIDSVVAGGITFIYSAFGLVSAVFISSLITKNKHAKVITATLMILCFVFTSGLFFVQGFIPLCIMLALAGITSGVGLPLIMSFPAILPEIGPEKAGTAGGLITTFMTAGTMIVPTFIVTPIAGSSYALMYCIDAAAYLIIALLFVLLPSVYVGKKQS